MGRNKPRITITISADVKKAVDKVRERVGLSTSSIVDRALVQFLKQFVDEDGEPLIGDLKPKGWDYRLPEIKNFPTKIKRDKEDEEKLRKINHKMNSGDEDE